MDFHALPRRDLQALAKRNGVRANMTNGAMADALAKLPAVDGIEEYVQLPVEEPTSAAEPVVQATPEEEEQPEISLPPDEVIVLDDSEEEKDLTPDEDEEKAPARAVGRRRVAWAEPLAATAKRNRPAARKADTAEAVAEAVPARATRGRSQRTVESVAADEAPKRTVETDAGTAEAVTEAVPARATRARSQRTVAEDEAPKTRRTSRRKAGTQQEEEEKATQGDASDVEPAMAAPVSSDEGGDGAMDVQNEEQHAPVEEQDQEVEGENEKEGAAAVAVPARATRARSQRTVLSAAEEVAPKTRRASRRTMEARDEEQQAPVEDQSQELEADTEKEAAAAVPVPARATRARSQRAVAEEEAPKTRRTSRRAVAKNNSTEQEDEEKATHGDVSDVEAAVPAPVSSHKEEDCSEEMEVAMDAQNAPIEVQSEEDEGETKKGDAAVEAVPVRATRARRQRAVSSVAEEAMPARATRARSQKTVVPVAVEEAPKGRRTSRRAGAKKTSVEQEEKEKRTQGDVSDMETDVPAPVSSDEEQNEAVCGSEEMEAATDAQNEEEQTTLVEEPSQEGEAGTVHEEEEQGQPQQDTVSDVETAVPAASSDEVGDCAEEIEASMDAEDEEQTEEQSQEDEGAVADGTPLVEEPAAAEDCPVYSSVGEQTDTVSSEEILHSSEDTEMVPVQEVPEATYEVNFSSDVSEENEHCTAEEEPPVAEDVDSSAQESPVDVEHASEENEELQVAEDVQHANEDCKVEEELPVAEDVQQCEATEEIQLASEETEMVPIKEMSQAMLEYVEATEEVDCTSDVDENEEFEEEPTLAELADSSAQESPVDVEHASEENEDCKVEEELPVAEDVQECEATEEIQLASEETEMVPIKEMSQAMLESVEAMEDVDCTSDVDENGEFEEEPTLAELADSSVLDVQQCETTEKIQLADEDTEMVPVLESGEATEEADFISDVVHASEENEVPSSEEMLQSAAKASEKKKYMSAEEVTNNTDMGAEEETLVATDEMPQMFEAMDEGVAEVITIDYLTQAKSNGEGGFTADLTDVSMEEETVVAADEIPLSLAKMSECVEEEVVNVDYLSQATDDEGAVKESGVICGLTDVSADDVVVAATKDENAEEVVALDKQSEAMVTDDEVHVNESGFTGELLDVFTEEQGVVADDEMLHSSAKMEDNVQEVVTVNNMWQATVTDDEGAAKESGFLDHLGHMSVDEEDVIEADEMQVCSATIEKGVEEVVAVVKLSQATVADDERAVTESAFTGECTPVVDTARDLSDRIASPWSVNVFEDATKSLSMDSIAVEPMVSEPADVPLCMYSSSGGKKDATEPVAVQRENDVKEGNEPEAALGKIIHSPLTVRKLRRAVAQENESDDVPLCIFISSSGGEENSAEPVLVEREKETNEPEAALAKIAHSPLTIRKLRRAVAEEIEADDVPLCIFTSSGDENTAEPVLVEPEKEVNEPEAALAKIAHSPLTIRKLRRAVAEENEADDVPLCIFTSSSGGEENSAEPVLAEREKEVNEHDALGSLRKLRTQFNQIVAVAQENEVKEGEKSSQALDKLSLRKLRTKLKETLNAHKNVEPKRVPLGRLDENAC